MTSSDIEYNMFEYNMFKFTFIVRCQGPESKIATKGTEHYGQIYYSSKSYITAPKPVWS
jgi:hypothetical protein